MKTEFSITLLVKLCSFFLGLLIAFELDAGNDEISRLVFIIGFSNLARMFDGSLPYMRRIEFASNKDLALTNQIALNLVIYSLTFIACMLYLNDAALSVLTVLCSIFYAQMSYYFNVLAKSYFLNLPQILGIASCLFLRSEVFNDIAYQFLFVTLAASLSSFVFISFKKFKKFTSHSFFEIYNSNYFFNFFSVVVFMVYAEFASVVLYGNISQSEYMDVNKIVKIQQAMIGAVSAVTAVLWNRHNTKISKIDKFTINSTFVTIIYLLGMLCAYLLFYVFLYFRSFFEENLVLLFSSATYIVFSSFNLVISQQMFRKSLSKKVFFLSILEALAMILVFIYWKNAEVYFIQLSLIHLIKFIVAKYMFRRFT